VDIWFPNGYDTANLQGVKALREVLAGKDDCHTTLLQQIAQSWHTRLPSTPRYACGTPPGRP
jgi:hypothetical protein